MQICENIKQARDTAGLSQDQMAAFLGVPRTTYANWEKKTEPTITIIKSIAEILKVNFYDLIDVEKPEERKSDVINNLSTALANISHTVKSQHHVIREYIEKEQPPDLGKVKNA